MRAGYTALHIACELGYSEVAEYLITQKADVNAADRVSCHAMIYDELMDRYDIITSLISLVNL